MSKKLNKTEIATLAKRILQEVNEVNKTYNATILASKAYIDEVERIKSQDPTLKVKSEIEKLLKVEFGTDYEKHVGFAVSSTDKVLNNKISTELTELNKKNIKPLYHVPLSSWDRHDGDKLSEVIDDITIAQIDITDVQLLINTIKAKLV